MELTESLEVQVFLEGFGGCEGSEGDGSGGDGFGGNGVMVSRISDGCRGFRRLRFQFRGSFFGRFRGGLGQAGTPAQMGFRRVLEAVWKVGTGLPGFHCRWKVSNPPPKIKSFDEQDATLLLGMPPELT